jgi:ketosteroid isomerase-like protein
VVKTPFGTSWLRPTSLGNPVPTSRPRSSTATELSRSALNVILRSKASGVELDYDYWAVFTFRDGRAIRVEWFEARADALEAAGLRE